MVGDNTLGPGGAGFSLRVDRLGRAVESQRRDAIELEIPLVSLGLLLLAIHGVNLVAEEQMQVLVAAARQLFFDRLELKKKIEPECADQREPGILRMPKFLDQRPQNGKHGGLLAA